MNEPAEPTPQELEHVATLLAALADEPLPDDVAARLAAAIDAEAAHAPPAPAARRRRPLRFWLPRLVVPVAAAAAVALVVVVNRDTPAEQAAQAPSSAAAASAPAAEADLADSAAAPAASDASAAGAAAPAAAMEAAPASSAAAAASSEAGTASAADGAAEAASIESAAVGTAAAPGPLALDAIVDGLAPYPGATPDGPGTDARVRKAAPGAVVRAFTVPAGTAAAAVLDHYRALLAAAGWAHVDAAVGVPGLDGWSLDGLLLTVDAADAPRGAYAVEVVPVG